MKLVHPKSVVVALTLFALGLFVAPGCSSHSGCDDGAGFPGVPACPDAGAVVDANRCVPQCSGRSCGSDGCGGTCGSCASGQTCGASGACTTAGGSVGPGGSCQADGDCDSSQCSTGAKCVDWNDGAGAVCSCTCSWGTDCSSGCCWTVNDGAFFACRNAAACAPVGGACSYQYECLNNDCGSFKTYCYGTSGSCGCGCSKNSDCQSGCCAPYGNPTEYYACSAPGTPGC